jgi:hypothetical protein
MSRLIDADKLEKQEYWGNERCFDYVDAEDIDNAPTVDAVPVVRCKDCKHSWEDLGGLTCSHGVCVDCVVLGDFYCANGERKKGADNG